MSMQAYSETDIRTKFNTPAVNTDWDLLTQIREEVSFTKVSTQLHPNFQPSFSQTSIDRFLLHA